MLEQYMDSPEVQQGWADPGSIARAVYKVVAAGKPIPLRVPLGADAWGFVKMEHDKVERQLEEVRELALSVGREGREWQPESVAFLTGEK
jgi:hypothetical protein